MRQTRTHDEIMSLFEGDEPWRVGGADTGATVLHRLVGDGELPQVMADHLGLWTEQNKTSY